jgi:glycosyl transferase family 87
MDQIEAMPRPAAGSGAWRRVWGAVVSVAVRTRRRWKNRHLWTAAALYAGFMSFAPWGRIVGFDSHAYWLVWHHPHMYGLSPNSEDAYLYSPAFAQMIWPLAQLPWEAFLVAWIVVGAGLYLWLVWPLGWERAVPVMVFLLPQALIGNVWPIFAVVGLVGFRRAGAWAFPLLTEITSGTGLIWFAVRREWRHLGVAVATTSVVVLVSFAISPHLWIDWIRLLLDGGRNVPPGNGVHAAYNIPLVYRLPFAVAIAAWAAATNRRGWLILTIGLASPVFTATPLLSNIAVLAALPRLRRSERA